MATGEHQLVDPPADERARELWLQHAAGFILFEDVRAYAMEKIDPTLTTQTRAAVQKGIDDALYGLMMVIDGVSGGLSNKGHAVSIDFVARLATKHDSADDESLVELNLRDGDGMCMGYHGWLDDDFGADPIVVAHPECK